MSTTARIVKKSEFVGMGALVQFIGVFLCFIVFPVGLVVGILLLIIGGRLAIVTKCSRCMGKVDKRAWVCQHCRAEFVPHD